MDNGLNELKKSIRMARQTAGLTREVLLIKALNDVFDQHVATEADWKSASLEACGAWRRQMARLLDALLFAACSADAYSGEDAQLGRAVEEIQEALESTPWPTRGSPRPWEKMMSVFKPCGNGSTPIWRLKTDCSGKL